MDRYLRVRNVLITILFANLVVSILKMIIGNIIKSTSLTADGFHSLADAASNIVGLIGIQFASKPIDKDHPYGHRKFETITGLFIAIMLFFLAGKIAIESIGRFFNPIIPKVSYESLIVLIITLVINIFVATYELKKGKALNSAILISDSMHTRSDIYISIGVLFTLIWVRLGLPTIIDPIVSLIISGFILHASYEIFASTRDVLVDKMVIDENTIYEIVMGFNHVKDCHKIRSRGWEDDIHVDLHIMTDPNMTIEESHHLTHDIEEELKVKMNKNIQVISHIEPFYEKPNKEI